MNRYHTETGFPDDIQLPKGRIDFTKISDHAKKMSKRRDFEIPSSVYLVNEDIVEIKVKDNCLFRVLIRQKYNESTDLCIVFNTEYKVITAWLIDKNDTHATLDTSVYKSN